MRLAAILSLFLGALSIQGGCNSVHVTSNWDPNVDFGSLSTWRFEQPSAGHPMGGGINQDDFESSRVEYAIRRNLQGKGLREATAGQRASFIVQYHQVVNSEMSIAKLNSYAGYGDDLSAGIGTGVQRNSGFGLSDDPFVDHYMQDTLFIDIASPDGGSLIWRGSGSSNRAAGGGGSDQQRVDGRVDKILADFPPDA